VQLGRLDDPGQRITQVSVQLLAMTPSNRKRMVRPTVTHPSNRIMPPAWKVGVIPSGLAFFY
jgi:hypothetical protein